MNKVLLTVIAISSVLLAACSNSMPESASTQSVSPQAIPDDRQMLEVMLDEHRLSVEAVTTAESITLGLGQRDEIGSDGMLFFLPEKRVAQFWMHGMRFALDMVWIDGGTVVGVEKDVPAPADPNSLALPSYSSAVPVTHVLELAAGRADELGVEVGSALRLEF